MSEDQTMFPKITEAGLDDLRRRIGAKQTTVCPKICPFALDELRVIRLGNLSRHPG